MKVDDEIEFQHCGILMTYERMSPQCQQSVVTNDTVMESVQSLEQVEKN